jgi:[ribosomal protein S5]-alanine N-acetyltransferase
MIWWPQEVPTLIHGLITLRPIVESDIPKIYASCQDPIIPAFTRVPHEYTMAHAEFFVREKTPKSLSEKTELAFAIDYGNGVDKVFAGIISFHSMDLPDLAAEIGYWISAEVRGKGVGRTATQLLTNFGFETMGFERIEALVNTENIASQKLLKSAGYTLEGILRKKSRRHDGSQIDMAMYSVLREEWKGL